MPQLALDITTNPWPLETSRFFALAADLLAFPHTNCGIRNCRRRRRCSYVIHSDETMPACMEYASEDENDAMAAISDEYIRLTKACLLDKLPSPANLPENSLRRESMLIAAEILARSLPPEANAKTFHQWKRACLEADSAYLKLHFGPIAETDRNGAIAAPSPQNHLPNP